MQVPPWSVFPKRRRIVTDDLQAVNCSGPPGGLVATRAGALRLTLTLAALGSLPAHGLAREREARTLPVFAILAGFPDRPLTNGRAHFVGAPGGLMDRLAAYWADVSAGRLRIVPTVGEPTVILPRARARYRLRPAALAADALAAFTAVAPPGALAALEASDALVVFFAGTGQESHVGRGPPDPWSNYTLIDPPLVVGSRRFDDACVIAERQVAPFGSFGVLCHEFGHLLGLPELYAPGGAHEGIGVWGLMGQGTWLGRGEDPPHPCAWSKLRLGWVDAVTIEETTTGVTLPAVETVPRVIKVPAVPGRPGEYYLLENRARVGADARLPGAGLLVWHVDENVEGFRTGQGDRSHKLLHLVEADGRSDLDRGHAAGGNRGDATDPWAGPPRWMRWAVPPLVLAGALLVAAAVFRGVRPRPVRPVLGLLAAAALVLGLAARLRGEPVCGPGTPGMAPYDGSPTRVVIRNLSPAGDAMRFDVLVAPSAGRD